MGFLVEQGLLAIFLGRVMTVVQFLNRSGLKALLCNFSWLNGASGCLPQFPGASGWTLCLGGVIGWASWLDQGLRLCSIIRWSYILLWGCLKLGSQVDYRTSYTAG